MKKHLNIITLTVLLCFTSIFAKEWSAEQKDVLASLNKYFSAVRQGNQKEIVSFWHPKFVGWDYAQALPMNYGAHLKMIGGIGKSFRFKKLEFSPLEIQVEGDIAIIHGNYDVIIQDSAGKEMPTSGPETITLVKKDNKWAMIGLVSMAKETPEEAKVEEQNMALVRQGGELINKGDFEAFKTMIAPEYLLYVPSRSNKPKSREEYIEGLKMLGKAFPNGSWNVEELLATGDKVGLRYTFRGTHRGEYEGIPATGHQIEFGGMAIFRIEEGKWVEEKVEEDALGFYKQLGMELKPKEVKK